MYKSIDVHKVSEKDYTAVDAVARNKTEDKVTALSLEDYDPVMVNTATEYYGLFNKFVNDGFAIREQMATVDGIPIYAYLFTFNTIRRHIDYSDYDTKTSTIDAFSPPYFAKRKICFTSGMHGNEKATPMGLVKFFDNLCYEDSYAKYRQFDYYVVPLANPTGFNANTRENYQSIDINRDAATKVSVEARAITEFIAKRNYDLFVDWHQAYSISGTATSPVIGYLSQAYNTEEAIFTKVNEAFSKAGDVTDKIVNKVFSVPRNTQGCTCWEGSDAEGVFRNFGLTYAKASCCFESSRHCVFYTGNEELYNANAMKICYTFQLEVAKALLDMVFDRF